MERVAFQRRGSKTGTSFVFRSPVEQLKGSVKLLHRSSTLQTRKFNPPAVIKTGTRKRGVDKARGAREIRRSLRKKPWQRIACPIRCDNLAAPPTSTKRRFAPLFEVRLYRGGEARGHAAKTVRIH